MDKQKLLIGLLVVSLFFNLYSVLRVNRLENQLTDAILNSANNVSGDVGRLESIIYQMQGMIGEMQREKAWVLSREITAGEGTTGPDDIQIVVEFALREVNPGAAVVVHYKAHSADEWTTVVAEAMGGNSFQAPLAVSSSEDYQYKLGLDGTVTEAFSLPPRFYKPRPVYPSGWAASESPRGLQDVEFFIYQERPLFEFFEAEQVRLRVYNNGQLTKTALGQPETGNNGTEWIIEVGDLDAQTSRVVLEVRYKDGSFVTGEIWPGEEYMERVRGFH